MSATLALPFFFVCFFWVFNKHTSLVRNVWPSHACLLSHTHTHTFTHTYTYTSTDSCTRAQIDWVCRWHLLWSLSKFMKTKCHTTVCVCACERQSECELYLHMCGKSSRVCVGVCDDDDSFKLMKHMQPDQAGCERGRPRSVWGNLSFRQILNYLNGNLWEKQILIAAFWACTTVLG